METVFRQWARVKTRQNKYQQPGLDQVKIDRLWRIDMAPSLLQAIRLRRKTVLRKYNKKRPHIK